MADIEARLKALEKRARADTERWHAMSGEFKAFSSIISAIVAPMCVGKPDRLRTIIKNLKNAEDVARSQNEHALMIQRLRHERRFLEARLKKYYGNGSSPKDGDAPRRRK